MHHFAYRNGVLHAEDVDVTMIAEEIGTPFYCYSTATLERHYRVFDEAFKGTDHMICYSMKGNSNQAVIKTMVDLGAGIDVVSEGELRRALALGVPGRKIVFSGVGKTAREMALALKEGIAASTSNRNPNSSCSPVWPSAPASAPPCRSASIRCRREDPSQDHDGQGREQVRHLLCESARGLCQGGRTALDRCRGHRHAHRQPDHRTRALREGLPAHGRPSPVT